MATVAGYRSVRFWDRIANNYAKKPVADEAVYQEKLRVTRSYFKPDMRLFEFGCGTGSTAITHAPHVEHIRAVDVSERMLEIARARSEAAGTHNISFEQSTIDELKVIDQRYDMVLGLSILHLLDDKDAAVDKVFAMLEPGGIFVSSTPCIAEHMAYFRYIAPVGSFFGLIPEVNVFGSDELRGSIEGGGFGIEHYWQPAKDKGVFIVARKPLSAMR